MAKKPVIRELDFMKPKGYEAYFTISELSKEVGWDISWIRKLESQDRIPKAKRVTHGELEIRLWSPVQVKEIKTIRAGMKRGRPKLHG